VTFELKTLVNYSDDALLDEIRRVSTALNGERLTQEKFLTLSRVHVSTIRNRFGSWKEALDRAGIDESIAPRFVPIQCDAVIDAIKACAKAYPGASPTVEEIADRLGVYKTTLARRFGAWRDLLNEVGLSSVPLGRRYTDAECFENIVALWTYYGRQPRFAELKQPPSTVGSKAYVTRWGGWRAALGAFIEHVEQPAIEEEKALETQEESSEAIQVPPPRSISLSLRYKVLRRDHFRCVLCGRSPANDHSVELHVDHIVAWSKGGRNVEQNLRTLCFECNLGKGDKDEELDHV
jgi:AraC-like DNA-binding protein